MDQKYAKYIDAAINGRLQRFFKYDIIHISFRLLYRLVMIMTFNLLLFYFWGAKYHNYLNGDISYRWESRANSILAMFNGRAILLFFALRYCWTTTKYDVLSIRTCTHISINSSFILFSCAALERISYLSRSYVMLWRGEPERLYEIGMMNRVSEVEALFKRDERDDFVIISIIKQIERFDDEAFNADLSEHSLAFI